MRTTRNNLIAATATAALVLGGAGAAFAGTGTGTGDEDRASKATGHLADRARTAALTLVVGGTANSVERDRENGATWEVEVTKPNGSTVDVRLDKRFKLVVIEDDTEEAGDEDGAGTDQQ